MCADVQETPGAIVMPQYNSRNMYGIRKMKSALLKRIKDGLKKNVMENKITINHNVEQFIFSK